MCLIIKKEAFHICDGLESYAEHKIYQTNKTDTRKSLSALLSFNSFQLKVINESRKLEWENFSEL